MKVTRRVTEQVDFEFMKDAIYAGSGSAFINPFDELEIPLENGKTVIAVCGGYVTDRRARFVLKDCMPEPHVMNKTATNKGGYYRSEGRRHVLEDIYPLFPEWLREAIRPRKIVEAIDGETVEYSDPLWLPSATDYFGPSSDYCDWWPLELEDEQLEIFKTERGRVKEMEGSGTMPHFLRSPYASGSITFVFVSTGGTVNTSNANNSLGFAPGFDL